MISNFVLVWNSCAKTEIINVSVSLIRTINLYCWRTEAYIMVVLRSLWHFISGITVYHAGIGDIKSPSCAGVMTIFRLSCNFIGGGEGRYCMVWIGYYFCIWFTKCVSITDVVFRKRVVKLIRNNLSAEYEARKSAAGGAQGKTTDSESDFPNRRKTQILAGLFATAAMTSYALSTGLLQVDLYFTAFKMFCFYYLQMFLYFLVI